MFIFDLILWGGILYALLYVLGFLVGIAGLPFVLLYHFFWIQRKQTKNSIQNFLQIFNNAFIVFIIVLILVITAIFKLP